MHDNILIEVKQLHNQICQLIFKSNRENILTKYPSPLQMSIIKYLRENKTENIYQKDIQNNLGISKAAISDVLQTMEKKEMITRIPSKVDGRKIKIVLTDKGNKLYKEVETNMQEVDQIIKENITQEEIEEFIRISHKIKENIKKEVIK